MKRFRACVVLAFCATALPAAVVGADSVRGSQVFAAQGCVQCHALNGVGATVGPDLGRLADLGFTPATLAATMWNHAPAMWNAFKQRNLMPAPMDEQQAADLFAFFYSLRFFEEPGDAARGKSLFTTRKCASCHGITDSKAPGARPVQEWTATGNPLELVETALNHSVGMHAEMARNNIKLQPLSGQDLADLLVYVRHAATRPPLPGVFRITSPDDGKMLFETKGCAKCHTPATHFLTTGLRGKTLTDLAVDMWNHGLDMKLVNETFGRGEMQQIAGYIWLQRALSSDGSASHGARVFTAKKCSVCHDDAASGAPALTATGASFSGAGMVSVLTRHGPTMLDRMREKKLVWPRFSGNEMSDLIAYLNTRVARNGR
jgi:mono/diheme cytochrome c family protein